MNNTCKDCIFFKKYEEDKILGYCISGKSQIKSKQYRSELSPACLAKETAEGVKNKMEKLNNKNIGDKFEKDFIEYLSKKGYWVHFLERKANIGSQPCDLIAIKRDITSFYDCKTLANKNGLFPINRIEENQRLAFKKLRKCKNYTTVFALAILWQEYVYIIDFDDIDFSTKSFNVKDKAQIRIRWNYEDNN